LLLDRSTGNSPVFVCKALIAFTYHQGSRGSSWITIVHVPTVKTIAGWLKKLNLLSGISILRSRHSNWCICICKITTISIDTSLQNGLLCNNSVILPYKMKKFIISKLFDK
jgi:hypothetical protein